MGWIPFCARTKSVVRIFIVLPDLNNSQQQSTGRHARHISWFWADQCLFILLYIVFEPTGIQQPSGALEASTLTNIPQIRVLTRIKYCYSFFKFFIKKIVLCFLCFACLHPVSCAQCCQCPFLIAISVFSNVYLDIFKFFPIFLLSRVCVV